MSIRYCNSEKHRLRKSPYKLSICIPTWNRASALERQLANIASTQNQDVEVVVIDNGSNDDTWNVIENEASVNRMHLKGLRSPVNLGIDINLLRAIENGSGEWIWTVGDDDNQINMSKTITTISESNDLPGAVTILLDKNELSSAGLDEARDKYLLLDQFMQPQYDGLCCHLFQVSRVACRKNHALEKLRYAYSHGIGNMHSQSYIYGPILQDTGLNIIAIDGFISEAWPTWYVAQPRWNLLNAHIGAWRSSIEIFSAKPDEARAREVRLRGEDVPIFMAKLIDSGQSLSKSDWQFARDQLSIKTHLRLRLKSIVHKLKAKIKHRQTPKDRELATPDY